MKIAVSGAVSTGKTTLGKALADGLDLPFIPENMDTLFGSGQESRKKPEEFAADVIECLEEKRALEQKAGQFVVDRSPLDLLNFWQSRMLPMKYADGDIEHDILELCGRYMAAYDFVILTSLGGIALTQESPDETGRLRTKNPWLQFKGSAMITGLAHFFLPPSKIIQIPRRIEAKEDRLDFVIKSILSRKNKLDGGKEVKKSPET